jgi:hypothetical protein
MKKELSSKYKWGNILSALAIFLGTVLLIYMIRVEDEPGAVPLILILGGIIWLAINQYQIKKQLHKTR